MFATLRPAARTDALFDVLTAPSRILAETCAPLRWLRIRKARAAERELIGREDAEYEARARLHAAERRAALPTTASLRQGRRFLLAEVVERRSGEFDSLVVRVDGDQDDLELEPGLPVVHGDHYIGRTARLEPPETGRLRVELATAREFAVGARLEALDEVGEPMRCVVGGVAVGSDLRSDLKLAVLHPSRRALPAADVVVDELQTQLAPYLAEAVGFRLGRLEATPRGDYAVAPAVDFKSGLFRVAIVAPGAVREHDGEVDAARADPLFDGAWTSARVLSCGQPSAWRDGFEISAGSFSGVARGAAFVVGARLIGRVRRVGFLSSDVTTLADPGWELHAVALAEGGDEPYILGALAALGRDAGDPSHLRFVWRSRGLAPKTSDGAERPAVQVFTGAGQPGVPSGLWVGATELPLEPGVHELTIRTDVDVSDLQRGFVRLAGAAP